MKVSNLSFGASSLGGVFRGIKESEGIEAVMAAVDNGINFIDVSPYYGHYKAETVLGKALKQISRDKYYLSTKVGRYGKDGVKNGLDKYTGKESLMLGVWNDRERNNEGDLSNARIYRKVTLKPGIYYFGAKFNTITRMPEQAYVFASASLCPTFDIPAESMAFAPIGRATANGGFYGITFTVKKKQEVVLGFQVDLTAGSPTQEFRADEVKLLNFLHETP